jgi:peptidoglycan/xylan/chitin deacetylase (PgdA/CDA1 family)
LKRIAPAFFIPLLMTLWLIAFFPSQNKAYWKGSILHPTFTPTLSPTPTSTPTPTLTPTPSPSPTPTFTPTPTPTPAPTPDGIRREAVVPILLYHYVSSPPPDANLVRREISVSPQQFEEHLRYFKAHNYTTITLRDLVYHLTIGKPLPPKPLIITFDDGYEDNYQNAFPLLRKYGFVATFFVITDFIDEGRPGYMTWEQIEEMARSGMEIGSHSRNHAPLRGKPLDYLVWQILGSRQTLEAHGIEPRFFSYPFGFYDDEVVKVLQSAHFWGAVTTKPGIVQSSDGLFALKRIRVNGRESLEQLVAKLRAYGLKQ